ncbi:MAG: VCBS repeat-containing protein [Planctomycetaceae bacterium]|nr:VCBS repeat-containing protein [Planctomycetaceae bacterium]
MTGWSRKRGVRPALVALVAIVAVGAWHAFRERAGSYVPGDGAEGLFDSLGRALPPDRPSARFVDATSSSGLVFRHFSGVRGNRLPEDMGSGVALGDVDGDGWTDAFLVNFAHALADTDAPRARCALFRNRGDGSFEDISAAAGADLELLGMAAAFLDYDSDGDLDLLVTSFGGLTLLSNDGAAHFRDVTAEAGLGEFRGFFTGLAIGDFDLDGAPDAYVCRYVQFVEQDAAATASVPQYDLAIPAGINPSSFEPAPNLLLRNRGDGSFEDVAPRLGVANAAGRSLGATLADLSGDGRPDLYVANDVSDNALYVGLPDGTFEDRTAPAQVGDYRGAMGLAIDDFDSDLDLDLVVTHWLAQENALYVNMRRLPGVERKSDLPLSFMDQADRFGLGQASLDRVGWATRFIDFDCDGLLDLFVINGSTLPRADDARKLVPQRSQLFWNAGGTRGFFELGASAGSFFGEEHVGRGGASFDFDLDGDEDMLVMSHGGPARLLRNDGGNLSSSVLVRVRQPDGNRFAIGAVVDVLSGGRIRRREQDTQGSYLSQHATGELNFGLGEATEIEELSVRWPDGLVESVNHVPANTLVTWEREHAPRIELLPGKRARVLAGPREAEAQRRFHATLDAATRQRVAGRCEEAQAGYRHALEQWPSHEDCLYNLGNCALALGRTDEALESYRRLVLFHPTSNRGWMQIGNLLLARGTERALEEAERAYERCHAINGEDSLPLVRLGVVALARHDLGRAEMRFQQAIVLNPRSAEAHHGHGRCAWLRGDEEMARERLARAHEAADNAPPVPTGTTNEGDTRSGKALLAQDGAPTLAWFERWRTLRERPVDPRAEYGDG